MSIDDTVNEIKRLLRAKGHDDQVAIVQYDGSLWSVEACCRNPAVAVEETGGVFSSQGKTITEAAENLLTSLRG